MSEPITIEAATFARALSSVAQIIGRRNTIPVLSSMRVAAKDGSIRLAATDMDIQLESTVPAKMNGRATNFILNHPRRIAGVIKTVGGDTVELQHEGGKEPTATVQVGGFTVKSPTTQVVDDWPEMLAGDPVFKATLGKEAMGAIRRVSGAVSFEETRFYLNGVHIHKSEGPWSYTVVATDGHRLYSADFPMPDAEGEFPKDSVIVPRRAVSLLHQLPKKEPVQLSFRHGLLRNFQKPGTTDLDTGVQHVCFEAERLKLQAKLIDGTFPDYERVIPSRQDHAATVEMADLKRALKAFLACSGHRRSTTIALDFAGGDMAISGRFEDATASTTVPFEGSAPSKTLGMNAGYLLDICRALGTETLTFLFGPDMSYPVKITSKDDAGFYAIQMPMRV